MESEPGIPFRPRSARLIAAATLPEVEFYFHLLVLIHLIDTECYSEASSTILFSSAVFGISVHAQLHNIY